MIVNKKIKRISLILLGGTTISILGLFLILNLVEIHNSFTINFFRMITIIITSIFFNIFLFLIDFNLFKKLFYILFSISVSFWSLMVIFIILDLRRVISTLEIYYELFKLIIYSLLGPGIISFTIYYIRTHSSTIRRYVSYGRYSLHEGFVGLIILLIAACLLIYRSTLIPAGYKKIETVIILSFLQVFILLFLFFAGFLIFRDINDILHFKFVHKDFNSQDSIPENFNFEGKIQIKIKDIPFYKLNKKMIFPIGIALLSFSINAMIHGTDFLPKAIFHLHNEEIISLGFIFCFSSGALLGRDWLRLFKIFYPELFNYLNTLLNKLKEKTNN